MNTEIMQILSKGSSTTQHQTIESIAQVKKTEREREKEGTLSSCGT